MQAIQFIAGIQRLGKTRLRRRPAWGYRALPSLPLYYRNSLNKLYPKEKIRYERLPRLHL